MADFWENLFGKKSADGEVRFNEGDFLLNAATGGIWGTAKGTYQTGNVGQAALNAYTPLGALNYATGNMGADNAAAINAASQQQMQREDQNAANLTAAGQQAQTGLSPYAQAGADAISMQRALAGLDGPDAQQAAIAQLQQSPAFLAQIQQQEQGILANASATGGLRGGDVQAALAQNRGQTLTDIINQQMAQYAGLAGAGQNAATNQGQFGLAGAGSAANFNSLAGQAQAGGTIGAQAAQTAGRNQAVNLGLQAASIGAGAIL